MAPHNLLTFRFSLIRQDQAFDDIYNSDGLADSSSNPEQLLFKNENSAKKLTLCPILLVAEKLFKNTIKNKPLSLRFLYVYVTWFCDQTELVFFS